MAPGACETAPVTRTVVAGDPDPLINTVTATYTAGVQSVTEALFSGDDRVVPACCLTSTKSCSPDPVTIGAVETCVIGVANTSSADSPDLASGTINDTLNGDLLAAGNPAVAFERLHDDACGGGELHDHHDPYGAGAAIRTGW